MKRLSKQTKGRLLSVAFIAFTLIFVLIFIFKTGDLNQIGEAFKSVNPYWFAAAIGCFVIQAFFEGWSLSLFFSFYGIKLKLGSGILIGLLGMYYAQITPAASGAQPMQVFALKKRGVPPGISSSVLAVKFFCWQLSFMLGGTVLWLMNHGLVYDTVGKAGIWLIIAGYLVNFIMVGAVILISISRNMVRAIIVFFVNVAYKFHYVKDVSKTSSKWDAALNEFHGSVEMLTKHPVQFLTIFVMCFIEILALQSVIYFIYRGFGLTQTSYLKIITIQFLLYIVASSTPLPGDSGAQEGGFYFYFAKFFPQNTIFAALILWRFITFYLQIFTGFIAVIIDQAHSKKVKRQKSFLDEERPDELANDTAQTFADGEEKNLEEEIQEPETDMPQE